MDSPRGRGDPVRYLLAGAGWVAALFGLLRLPAIEEHVLVPATRLQGLVAALGQGPGPLPVRVGLECSGADVIAVLVASCLSFPCPWRRRLAAAAGGVALLAAVNVARIASLAQAAGTDAFLPLHLYVWPAALVLVALAYAIAWMGTVDGGSGARRWLPFATAAGGLVCLFVALLPRLQRLPALEHAAAWYAASAAAACSWLGQAARADGGILVTPNGAFLVTPECLVTPLMPVFLAAALTLPATWRGRVAGVLAFVPVFAALAGARLIVLALPAALLGSPLPAVHGFNQILVAALAVAVVGLRGGREGRTRRLALAAAAAGLAVAAAPVYGALVEGEAGLLARWWPHTRRQLESPADAQGALVLLPAFQIGLFAALWLAAEGARRLRVLAAALAVLHGAQLALLVGLGELAAHAATPGPVTLVRAWALLAPVVLYLLLRRTGCDPPRLPDAAPV